jgi:hypothetical protein
VIHPNSTANHILENFVYADCVARMAATGLVTADIGKIAWQTDTSMYYRLLTTAPTWDMIGMGFNGSTSAQGSITAGTRTYLTGSQYRLGKFVVTGTFRWTVSFTKTAVGTGTTVFDIAIGTLGTTGDTARVSFTGPTETATADTATIEIVGITRVVSASGIVAATLSQVNSSVTATPTTGFKTNAAYAASAAFDNSANNLFIGLCVTPGAADVFTVNNCTLEIWNTG